MALAYVALPTFPLSSIPPLKHPHHPCPKYVHPHVLLTGGNGYVGFHVLHHLLKQGHAVRAVLRSPDKASFLTSHPALAPWKPHLTTAIVPDFTSEAAWPPALADITHIVHVAAPAASTVPTTDLDASYVAAGTSSTLALLRAIHAAPALPIRRIVITSSVVALAPPNHYAGPLPDLAPGQCITHTESSRVLPTPALSADATPLLAYNTAKAAALNAAEEWVRAATPRFDVVHVMPALVSGGDLRAAVRRDLFKSTAMLLVPVLSGGVEDTRRIFPFPLAPGVLVHVQDVCEVHAAGLLDEERVPWRGGAGECESLLVTARRVPFEWVEVNEIVARRFADEVREGVLKNGGSVKANLHVACDGSVTEERLGVKFRDLEEIAVDLVKQWLELPDDEVASQGEKRFGIVPIGLGELSFC